MKSSFLTFGGCMTVSVVDENAHSAVVVANESTTTAADSDNNSAEETTGPRRRSSSLEAWLHKTLRKGDDPEAEAARAIRRAKRKAFFRKLFGQTISDELDESTTTRPSVAVDLSRSAPTNETAAYRLNDIYYASMASILDQYTSDETCEKDVNPADDCDKKQDNDDEDEDDEEDEEDDDDDDLESTTDLSEVSVFDLQEDQDLYDDEHDGDTATESEDEGGGVLGVIPESTEVMIQSVTRPSPPAYVSPPVHIPMEYTIQDRRGGTLVAGHTVLFTSAGFKRKQRQLRYTMRAISEHKQFREHSASEDSDEEEVELSSTGIVSDWV